MAIQSAQKKSRGGSRATQKASKLLVGLWPSEVRAIQACRTFLRREQQCEISLQETLEIWEGRISRKWRAEKMKIDGQMQLREIEQHQSRVQEKEGRKLDWETAAQDWVDVMKKLGDVIRNWATLIKTGRRYEQTGRCS